MAIGSVDYGGGNAFPYGPPKGTIATTANAINNLLSAVQQKRKEQYDKTLLYQLTDTLGMTTSSQQNKNINKIADSVKPGQGSQITAKDWENLDFNQLMGKMWNSLNQNQTKDFIPDVMEQRLQGQGKYKGPTTQLETTLLNLALQEVQNQPSPQEKMNEFATIFANMKNAMTSEGHLDVAKENVALQEEQLAHKKKMDKETMALKEKEFSKNAELVDAQVAKYSKKEQWEHAQEAAKKALNKNLINEREYLSILNRYDLTDKSGDLAKQKEAVVNSLRNQLGREPTEQEILSAYGISSGTGGSGSNIKGWIDSQGILRDDNGKAQISTNATSITSAIEGIKKDIAQDMRDPIGSLNEIKEHLNNDQYYNSDFPNNALYPGQKAEDIALQALDDRMTNSKYGIMPIMEDLQVSDTGRLKNEISFENEKGELQKQSGMDAYEDSYRKYEQTLKDMEQLGRREFNWYLSPENTVTTSGIFGFGKQTRVTANPMERTFIMELGKLANSKETGVNTIAEAWNSLSDDDLKEYAQALSSEYKRNGMDFEFNSQLINNIIKQNTDIAVQNKAKVNINPDPNLNTNTNGQYGDQMQEIRDRH